MNGERRVECLETMDVLSVSECFVRESVCEGV